MSDVFALSCDLKLKPKQGWRVAENDGIASSVAKFCQKLKIESNQSISDPGIMREDICKTSRGR